MTEYKYELPVLAGKYTYNGPASAEEHTYNRLTLAGEFSQKTRALAEELSYKRRVSADEKSYEDLTLLHEDRDEMLSPAAEGRYEKLTLADDFMFGKIMACREDLCKELLELVLGIRIARIRYIEPQKDVQITADGKGVRFDVYVDDDNQTVYDMEMQAVPRNNLPKRSRYYGSMMDLNMIEHGVDYKELRQSFVIFICKFNPFDGKRHFYTFENTCKEEQELPLGDGTAKIFLCTKGQSDDISGEMAAFLDYLTDGIAASAFTKRLDDAVCYARRNKEWRIQYMTMEMALKEKLDEGVEKGIKKGIKQRNKDIALKLLKKDAPLTEIMDITELSPEEIYNLQSSLSTKEQPPC